MGDGWSLASNRQRFARRVEHSAVPRAPDPDSDSDSDPGSGLTERQGWAVAALLLVCLVVVPLLVWVRPPTFVPFQAAYLALAAVPGFLLGGAAVWLTVHTRR
jgi:hypothetical protein